MRGSIRRHTGRGGNGAWSYRVELPVDPATGRRRQLRRSFATRKEAETEMAKVLAEANEGGYIKPPDGTIGDYMATWLDGIADQIRPTTLYSYRKTVNGRIIPELGRARLASLDAATIEAWYARLRREGGRDGRPLSAKTVACVAGVLHKALSDAVRLRRLRYNPASDARLPKRERPKATAWTADEATTFLAATLNDRWYPMWRLVLATGLRRGELLGLRWQDLDLETGRLEVVETRVIADREVVGPPKTTSGARLLGLDASTVAVLRGWRLRLREERLAAGPVWTDGGRVFVDEWGTPPHPESVTSWWNEAVQRAGCRRIRLHDARHTAATLALRAGEPVKVVSQRLGHAHVSVTMGIYQHVTAQDDQVVADTLGRLLDGG